MYVLVLLGMCLLHANAIESIGLLVQDQPLTGDQRPLIDAAIDYLFNAYRGFALLAYVFNGTHVADVYGPGTILEQKDQLLAVLEPRKLSLPATLPDLLSNTIDVQQVKTIFLLVADIDTAMAEKARQQYEGKQVHVYPIGKVDVAILRRLAYPCKWCWQTLHYMQLSRQVIPIGSRTVSSSSSEPNETVGLIVGSTLVSVAILVCGLGFCCVPMAQYVYYRSRMVRVKKDMVSVSRSKIRRYRKQQRIK